MSSRSPSPLPRGVGSPRIGGVGGGWSSPGLNTGGGSGSASPGGDHRYSQHTLGPSGLSWAAAKAKSDQIRGYPSFSTRNSGFFSRQKRKISASLPRFRLSSTTDPREQEKFGRGGSSSGGRYGDFGSLLRSRLRQKRYRLLLLVFMVWLLYLEFWDAIIHGFRRTSWGGGPKVVILLGANVEGGVMELKGAREWAIERNSIWNKKKYAQRWGHQLEVVNMVAKKRYAHEWRESWEKVDAIREAMRKYPNAEWFWWLDLHTWIMEYSYSLEDHLFRNLGDFTYRDINYYNPLNITHPLTDFYLDPIARSKEGDGEESSISMVVPQDCMGFNLGSFFMRRSVWSDRLLDMWWDPVMYEQKHMEWEHKEQDSLEYLYANQPWVRNGLAFVPQRRVSSFPVGACGDVSHRGVHYQEGERDFVVNLAGCQWGRDCWEELYEYRELSNWLNRTRWERFKDGLSGIFNFLIGKKKEDIKLVGEDDDEA